MKLENISKKWTMMLSVCIVLFCYGFAAIYGAMTYHTNDDVSIQNFIWEASFDGTWWIHPWVSIILTYPLGILTRLIPIKISWWYVASQTAVAASLLVIHYVSLRIGQIRKMPLWLVLAFLAIVDSIFSVVCIAEIAFTMVPAMMGSAVIALAFYFPHTTKRRTVIACGVAGLLFAIAHRWESGTIAAGFFMVALVIVLSEKYGLFNKKMVVNCLLLAVLVGSAALGVRQLNNVVKTWAQGEEWVSYTAARSDWIDFRKETYEEAPELYEAVGWTADTYWFAKNWIFLSDEVTESAFRNITENSRITPQNVSVGDNLRSSVQSIAQDNRMCLPLLVTVAVCGFTLAVKLCERDWKSVLWLILDMMACCAVMGYLMCFVGRVIFRTVYIILLPTVLVAVFILIDSWRNCTSEVWKRVVAVSLVLLTGIWLLCGYECTQILEKRKHSLERLEREHLVLMSYESTHADKTFICQGYNFITYKFPDTKPITNATSMGGSLWRSNYLKHFQQVNNIERFNWTVFELPHIYFLGRFNENTVRVLDYLQREYACKGIAVVEQLEEDYDVYCMKFVYEDNLDEYVSYYTVVDGVFVEVTG